MKQGSRRRFVRVPAIAVGGLALLVVLALGLLSRVHWGFDCENSPLRESLSPDGARKIVVLERSCGATTGFSTQASLLKSGQALPSAELLTAAQRGRQTIITRHGRPVAVLAPISGSGEANSQRSLLPLAGSSRGLYGRDSRATLHDLRDEWDR